MPPTRRRPTHVALASPRALALNTSIAALNEGDNVAPPEVLHALRQQIDDAAEAHVITLGEWRLLVEQCAQLRRQHG